MVRGFWWELWKGSDESPKFLMPILRIFCQECREVSDDNIEWILKKILSGFWWEHWLFNPDRNLMWILQILEWFYWISCDISDWNFIRIINRFRWEPCVEFYVHSARNLTRILRGYCWELCEDYERFIRNFLWLSFFVPGSFSMEPILQK